MPGTGPGQHENLTFLPERVARKSFTASFRGFDQLEVKAYLGELATELRALREREERLSQELIDARLLAERAQQIDESKLTAVLGEETAKVLDTARQAAVQIKAKAEEHAARIVAEGRAEADALRAGAETEVERRVSERQRELVTARAEVEARRRQVEEEATKEIVASRERGREMVAEAQLVRERVLKDMVRRRRLARQQIEQLRAARERLLASYAVVRRTLEDATGELSTALPEAKLAAELAGQRLVEQEGGDPEEELTPSQLEAEVVAAQEELGEIDDEDVPAAEVVEATPVAAPVHDVTVVADRPAAEAEADPEPEPEAAAGEGADASQWFDTVTEEEETPPPIEVASSIDDGIVEERKSSTLRIFRRRPAAEPHHTLVSTADELEGVRIIRPEPEPEPEPVAVEPEPVEAEPVEAEQAAEAEATPEQAPVEEPVPAAEIEPEPAEPVADEAAPEPEPEAEAAPAAAAPAGKARVDALFARMRAEREASVAQAQEVLAQTDPPSEALEAAPAVDQPDEPVEPVESVEAAADRGAGAAALARRDDAVAPLEQSLTRRLKRVLADEQNEVLDLLRRARSRPSAAELLPAVADHVARYQEASAEALGEAWRAGASSLNGSTVGGSIPDDVLAELGPALVEPLRARVERAVADADGHDELDEAVRSSYRELRSRLADGAVRHVVLAAYSAGLYDAAPADATLCWVVDNGGVPCPDADDNALAGALAKGEPFPTGHLRPPAHAGCRCLVVPDPG